MLDCFVGQPLLESVSYRIDPGRPMSVNQRALDFGEHSHSGLRNAEIRLNSEQLLSNLHAVQRKQGLPLAERLEDSIAGPSVPNFDIEMETGTGKTYVYIKTMMELHHRFGWSKFIVVVPSVAIREGVKKSFDVTAEHFQQLYGTRPRAFTYSSTRLHELERFSSDAGVQVMIINIQAFNTRRTDQRRIYDALDDFQSRRPIDVIRANRPIVIIDEPQKMSGNKSQESLAEFRALMILRYSATHRVQHNKVHRLDAVDAYNQKLVKRIAVRGITVKGLVGSSAYLYLEAIEIAKGARPRARVDMEVRTSAGQITRQTRRLDCGANLYDMSGGIEAYRDLFVTDIDASRDLVELNSGDTVVAGQLADRDVTEDSKRRIQIREVIRSHIDKEYELFTQGIKVLSLFFIDEVVKYRDYGREDTLGDYARIFEQEYAAAVDEVLAQLALDEAASGYQEFLQRDAPCDVHEGYFSIDKRTKQQVDSSIAKSGDDKGQSRDVDAYDLILRNKERLLSLAEPVRFIFSHSALREGWDNPNVFTMGMLKKSDNTVSRRQEIGRGLRLAVDQGGERMDNPAVVHDINELTVVTDESYTEFVAGLQQEVAETLSTRPRKATADYFTGKLLEAVDGSGERLEITRDQAQQLQHWLTVNGFIDYQQLLTQKWLSRIDQDVPELPAGLEKYHHQVAELIDSLHLELPWPADGRKPKRIPLNEANFAKREFQELWNRISHRSTYRVEFDSTELIVLCVGELDAHLRVSPMQYVVQTGEQRSELEAADLASGTGFDIGTTTTHTEQVPASSRIVYDLLGAIAEKTQLTRRTVSAIMRGIRPSTFAKYRQNPEQFIAEAARLINEQKATLIVEHLSYDTVTGRYDAEIFSENQSKQDFANAGERLTKHIYEYVITDSQVERDFVNELETSAEVAVYAKLPRGFLIPTPVGNYNPDWAIAFEEDSVEYVYFIAETKGSRSSMQLRATEQAKIDCARKFFAALNAKNGYDVQYDVITDYSELMSLVGQP